MRAVPEDPITLQVLKMWRCVPRGNLTAAVGVCDLAGDATYCQVSMGRYQNRLKAMHDVSESIFIA